MFRSGAAIASRDQIARTSRGIIAESCDWPGAGPNNASALTGGFASVSLVGLQAGDVITNVIAYCTDVGAGVTYMGLGLYRADGTRLGSSADVKAALAVGAFLVAALSAPVTIDVTAGYYLALLATAAPTTPSFEIAMSAAGSGAPIGAGRRSHGFSGGGLANLDGNIVIGNANTHWWQACS